MEKPQLINFIAKVMEDSGFKVNKNFKTSKRVIDIYAILPTTIGDFGVAVACKNYDKDFEIGVDVLKEMEEVGESIKASKVTIVSSSYFSEQSKNYALKKNIKLVDRDNLLELARKYQDKTSQKTLYNTQHIDSSSDYLQDEYSEYNYDASDMEYIMQKRDVNSMFYKNTLYSQNGENHFDGIPSMFNRSGASQQVKGSLSPNNHYNYNTQSPRSFSAPVINQNSIIFKLIKNPIIMVILVVVISHTLSLLFRGLLGMDSGISGLIELVVALLLSYGLALYADRNSDFVIKGTFVFFVSLIILILLIFI